MLDPQISVFPLPALRKLYIVHVYFYHIHTIIVYKIGIKMEINILKKNTITMQESNLSLIHI